MIPPVPIPSKSPTTSDHCTGQVARLGRSAPSCRARTTRAALRSAGHGWTSDQDMSLPRYSSLFTDQTHEGIARLFSSCPRTRLIWPAAAVHFARCDARQTNARSFRAPDRAVSIPNTGWCAGESCPLWRVQSRSNQNHQIKNGRVPGLWEAWNWSGTRFKRRRLAMKL